MLGRPAIRLPPRGARRALIGRAVALGLLLGVAAPTAHAGTDPDREWFTLETEHFAVHSYRGAGVCQSVPPTPPDAPVPACPPDTPAAGEPGRAEALAREVAAYAEEARVVVGERLGWYPENKTHVVLIDSDDGANGFASVLPYNSFTVLAYPPEAASELGTYANWLKLLVFHEYAHIAHIDHVTGLPDVFNVLFGRTLFPNEALPRWVTEGIATYVESTDTGGGRVGSSRFEMFMRASALADALPTLDRLTGFPLEHPRGSSWYMYGGYLFHRIAAEAGPAAVRDFIDAYGRRIVPYSLNLVAEDTTGKTLVAWHAEQLDAIRARAAATVARVTAEGLAEGHPRTTDGESKLRLRWSPDGRHLAYVRVTGHEPAELVVAPRDALDRPTDIIECDGGCGGFDFTRDARHIVLGTGRFYRQVNTWGVLREIPYATDLPNRAGRVFPHTVRGHDPAVDPDGRRAWFVRNDWGRTWLEAVDLATGDVVTRFEPPSPRDRIDQPAPTRDGRVIVSMVHDGNRDLWAVDAATGAFTRLTEGAAIELDPHVTADGRWLVYASDAHERVYNVFARDLATGETRRLTNLVTGAFFPAVSPDGGVLAYARWSHTGYDLHTMRFAPESAPLVAEADPLPSRPAERPVATAISAHDYQALPTMLPRSWVPSYEADSTGLSRLGLELTGVDASGRFAVTLSGEWDFAREDFSALVAFDAALGFPNLSLAFGRYSSDRSAFIGDVGNPYTEEVFFGTVSASVPLPDMFVGLSIGASFTVDVARALEVGELLHTPDEFIPFIPREGASTALNLYWSFGDVQGTTYGISPFEGKSVGMNLRLRDPAIGSARSTYSLTWTARAYVPMPWLEDHVAFLRLEGGISGGDPGSRGIFSVGGVPDQDLFSDLLNQVTAGAVWLRGFEPGAFSGLSYELATLEYRFPLLRVRRGLETFPVFVEDLSLAVFSDVGGAQYGDPFEDMLDALRVGIGAELRFSLNLFYGYGVHFRLGYARGLGDDGIDQVYFLLANDP